MPLNGSIEAHALHLDRSATRRELARIRHEVDDDLSHFLSVRANDQIVTHRVPAITELLRVDLGATHRVDREADVAHRERRDPQLHAPSIDASEVEQIIDDRE